ncbi:hypothetical protein AB0M47_32360 [Hamadaea sp. NPDC051192]|uniref:hypothetical protein n=1 Tax=Hamadaea sp. NPDC051192 TaxID=3154940 RepID=UPI0034358003
MTPAKGARAEDCGLGAPASPIGTYLDAPDPEGTVLRFLADNPISPGSFVGVAVDMQDGVTYDAPIL